MHFKHGYKIILGIVHVVYKWSYAWVLWDMMFMLIHGMVLGEHVILDARCGQDLLGYILYGIKSEA